MTSVLLPEKNLWLTNRKIKKCAHAENEKYIKILKYFQ